MNWGIITFKIQIEIKENECNITFDLGWTSNGKGEKLTMDDTLMSEEYEEGDSGTSGILTLDGEAWKNRDNTTYNSLLDINGVTDLFSQESTDHYNDRKQESYTEQQELTEYLFSEQVETENAEENEADMIFSEEIRLSRSRDYSRNKE